MLVSNSFHCQNSL